MKNINLTKNVSRHGRRTVSGSKNRRACTRRTHGCICRRRGHETPGSGRTKGIKNKLSHKFLQALAADFEEHGDGVIRICRVERPHEYLKLIAGLMPREFEVTNTHITEIPDANLDELIYVFEERIRGFIAGADGGEAAEANGEQTPVLQALSETALIPHRRLNGS
jgi:hypothetical protein